jgi:hypothetical protein
LTVSGEDIEVGHTEHGRKFAREARGDVSDGLHSLSAGGTSH